MKATKLELRKALILAVDKLVDGCEDCPCEPEECVGISDGVDGVEPTDNCSGAMADHFISLAKRKL